MEQVLEPQSRAGGRAGKISTIAGRRIRAARLERGLTLADVGGKDLSRSFLSQVELGRCRISLRSLAIVAERLQLPIGYFLDSPVIPEENFADLATERADAALIYSVMLHRRGDVEGAYRYALRAVALQMGCGAAS